jgi:hypothetical protein
VAEDGLYLWNQERALEVLKTQHLICRVCGQTVPRYPNEALLRHILTHVEGAKRKEVEDLIAYFSDPENRYRYALHGLGEMSEKDIREFIDTCRKHGIVARVPDEK